MMLWFAVLLAVVSAASFVLGFVLYANGAGVAPHRRTKEDPTGVKRAGSRVEWPDVFRRMPRSVGVLADETANRSDRLSAAGSFFVLVAVVALCLAVLALIAAFL